jgi:Flp pilus assembly protein TadG
VRVRWRDERGAALIEAALIMPLFAMLVFGMLSGGSLYNRKMQITQAAREGARYGMTVPADQTFADGGTWVENVRAVVLERAGLDLGVNEVCVSLVAHATPTVVGANTTRADGTPCFDDSAGGEDARRVQVHISRPGVLDAIFVRIPVDLTARASGRHENG